MRRIWPLHRLGWLPLLLGACSRHADIAGEPDGGLMTVLPPSLSDAGPIPIEIGPDGGIGAGCAERPFGQGCRGANDFPCAFASWVSDVAELCAERTGCRPNGVLAAQMGEEGCVVGIAMSEPHQAFERCAIEEFSAARCECDPQRSDAFLGIGNAACE